MARRQRLPLTRQLDDQRRGRTAFRTRETLHQPERRGADFGPARAVGSHGTGVSEPVQPVIDCGAGHRRRKRRGTFGTVVGHEDDQGAVVLADSLQVVHQPTDVPIQVADHRGVDLHQPCLACAFRVGQLGPAPGARTPLARPGDARVRLHGLRYQTQLLHALDAPQPDRFVAGVVAALLGFDVGHGGLQRPVRRGIGRIGEEGFAAAPVGIDPRDQLVGEGGRGEEVLRQLRGRKDAGILGIGGQIQRCGWRARREVRPAAIDQRKRALEATRMGQRIGLDPERRPHFLVRGGHLVGQVPFAHHHRVVAAIAQQFGHRQCVRA